MASLVAEFSTIVDKTPVVLTDGQKTALGLFGKNKNPDNVQLFLQIYQEFKDEFPV